MKIRNPKPQSTSSLVLNTLKMQTMASGAKGATRMLLRRFPSRTIRFIYRKMMIRRVQSEGLMLPNPVALL